ncbi:putative diacylglycerol O-acyltransferase tgs1 [Vanrija albida]|uniref:Trimethylguanosine synthase n=1 Tax=Vanrija albida TaxID=181172 RepID=A0ABR3PVW1_9TREE
MPRKKYTAPRSVFFSLSQEIRRNLRAQPRLETFVAEDEDSPAPSTDSRDLLPTQPPADDSASEDEEDEEDEAGPTPAMSAPPPKPPVVISFKREADLTDLPPSKRRKGKGRADDNPYAGHPWDCTGLVPRYTEMSEVPKALKKYFAQRHSLFPSYSRLPLLMDDTGWFSVTPAAIAGHIAERCRCDVILDAFCGVGGNAIAFAQTCERVIAMDNDPVRLRLARHNALHHGVADRIEFVLCDYVAWARAYAESGAEKEHIDVVFLSPPWGGPEYLSFGADGGPLYPLSAVEPIPGDELFRLTAQVTPNIAYFLPRNVDVDELGVLAQELGSSVTEAAGEREREWVEVEEEWVGDKLKAVTAYYGSLVG